MRDAYRDDLAAAQLRVQDLEHEHAALAAESARLQALADAPRRAAEQAEAARRARQDRVAIVTVGIVLALAALIALTALFAR